MRGKILLVLFLSVLILGVASAEKVTVQIKTLAYAEVQFNAYEEDNYRAPIVQGFEFTEEEKYADEYGDWETTINVPTDTYSLRIFVRKDKKDIENGEYEERNLDVEDNPYYIEILPDGILPKINPNATGELIEEPEAEVIPEEEIIVQETQDDSFSETGKAIINEVGLSQTGYIFAAVACLVIAGFLGFKMKGKKNKKEIKITKLSEKKKDDEEKEQKSSELEEAEEQLKKAQERIQQLKEGNNKSEKDREIEAAKKKLIEDEQRLMKLREEK